nr:hypothetical protein [Nocardia vinacea]
MVHHIEHAFHSNGMRTFAEVLLGADQTNTHLVELGFDDRCVESVAKRAGTHIDDDVADFGVLGQVLEELPEHRTFVDGLGRVAGLDELRGHFHAHGVGFGIPLVALGGDRQTVGVDVDSSVELLLGRDA